ncbi:MAG: arginase family protein [Solirubrobacterales bacterium]|nr:arginase family protein [Solirubrobacterales bacterium]
MSRLAASALLCRTSDRVPEGAAGAAALAERIGARVIGAPGAPRTQAWEADLADARGCLLEAGGQVEDALEAGDRPLLLAGDCSIAVSTLPVLARLRPAAWICWIDAHADFNTPTSSESGYLGGMPLAGACGLWETGFGDGVDPARVAMLGVRDVDGPERVALDTHGVGYPDGPSALEGAEVFLHLDLDVLDPSCLPAPFPAPDGWTFARLRRVLTELAELTELVGVEITGAHPDHTDEIHRAIVPLLG